MYNRTQEIASLIEAVATGPFIDKAQIDQVLNDAKKYGYCRI